MPLYTLMDRRRRKHAAARSLRHRAGRLALGCGAFALLLFFAGLAAAGGVYAALVQDLPSPQRLAVLLDPADGPLLQPTRIYDRSGQVILYSLENPGIPRRYLSVDPSQPRRFSPELVRATLGMLDPSFWTNPGFSLRGLADGQPVTIAERLVDDLLLAQEPRGVRRALRMRLLAAQVTAQYGRVRVLEWYLNSAFYGHLAYGADSAARLYLDKSAQALTIPEAALLVAAAQAPGLNPLDAPDTALERQRAVLDTLLVRGVITLDEHNRAVLSPLRMASPVGQVSTPAAGFSRLVVERLAARFGRERLERGGLRVITSLDYALQQQLTCLVRTQLSRLAGEADTVNLPDGSPCDAARLLPTLPPGENPLPIGTQASAVVLDPRTGQVLAMLGDTTLSGESPYLTPRQPGSLLTPFVALAGFARGSSPASLVWDTPSSLPAELSAYALPGARYAGPVRLRTAIANDDLTAQARLLVQIGAPNVWRLAGSLGIPSLADESDPSLIYQGGQVNPLELAQAYGVFANQGLRVGQRAGADLSAVMVLYVESVDGEVVWDARQPETQAAVSPQLAYLVHHVLSDAPARWPSLGYPNPLEIGRPAGAKVGRVQGDAQIWTTGYTPQRVAVFWLGLPAAESPDPALEITPRMVGGMWHALIQYASRDLPPDGWTQPSDIRQVDVCSPSGQLPTAACPEVVSEVFLAGNEPNAPDTLYRSFRVNRETGRLATVFTAPSLVEERTFLVVPQEASEWARAAGLPLPPVAYDAIQPPAPSPLVRMDTPALYAFVRGTVSITGTAAGQGFQFYQLQVGAGLNPQTWLQIGADGASPVTNDQLGVWDTTGQEGLYSVRLLVVRADQRVETAITQVTVDNTPPQARVAYPSDGQQIADRKRILFQAELSDAAGIQKVTWLVDGRPVGESVQAPFALDWPVVRGQHTLEVLAVDRAGNETRSALVRFSVP